MAQDRIGNVIELRQNTLKEFRVSPGMQRLPIWEWGEMAPLRLALGPNLQEAIPAAIRNAQSRLETCTAEEFRELLSPALDLVSPVGMDAKARAAWIKAAVITLSGLPRDLLAMGCRVAMETCDHPSKIVPTVMKATKGALEDRKRAFHELERVADMAQREPAKEQWQIEKAGRVIPIERGEREAAHKPKPHEPKRADYLAMGVTAGELDEMGIHA